jgi:hypothetical protein
MLPSLSCIACPAKGIPLQAEAVGDHEGRGQGHRGGGDDRVKEAEGGQRDRRDVVPERPCEVAADGAEGGACEANRVGDGFEIIAEQDHIGGADRHVGPGAEGEPEVGGGQRRAVVDAVADHCHPVPARAQSGDDGCLAGRQRARYDLVDARRGRDRPRGRLAVPGQQDGAQAEFAQSRDGRRRRGLDGVGHREGAHDGAIPADQHRGAARLLPLAALPS